MINLQHHVFSVEIASHYGVNTAILLNQIAIWVLDNEARNENFYNNHYWVELKFHELPRLFAYWTIKEIKAVFEFCLKTELIEIKYHNNNSYIRIMEENLVQGATQ